MKKTKKILCAAVALTLSSSMCMFAACGSSDPTPETSTPIYAETENSTPEVKSAVDAFAASSLGTVTADVDVEYTNTDTDAEYDSTTGLTTESDTTSGNIEADIALNLTDGNMDFYGRAYESDAIYNSTTNEYESGYYENYTFARDWQIFTANLDATKTAPTKVSDYSALSLIYEGNMQEEMAKLGNEYEALYSQINDNNVKSLAVAATTLADNYNAVTVSDTAITVDVNKALYNILGSVKNIIANLKEDSTLGNLLACKPVKALVDSLEIYTGYTPATLLTYVNSILEALKTDEDYAMMANAAKSVISNFPEASDSDTLYDYLVKIFNDKDTTTAIKTLLGTMGIELEIEFESLAELEIMDIATIALGIMGGQSTTAADATDASQTLGIDIVKALLNSMFEGVTATESSFTVTSSYEYRDYVTDDATTLSNVEITLELTNGAISSMDLTANIAFATALDYGTYEYTASNTTSTANVSVKFNDTTYTFANIDNAKVYTWTYADTTSDITLTYNSETIYTVAVKDGVITVKDSSGTELASGTLYRYVQTESDWKSDEVLELALSNTGYYLIAKISTNNATVDGVTAYTYKLSFSYGTKNDEGDWTSQTWLTPSESIAATVSTTTVSAVLAA